MKNESVITAWINGRYGKSHNGNLWTDGTYLYSYKMVIGYTLDNGLKLALNVRGENRYSQTTSRHVSLASQKANHIVEPKRVYLPSGAVWYVFPHVYFGTTDEETYPELCAKDVTAENFVDMIIQYETEGLSLAQEARLFQYIADNRINLQGAYGRRLALLRKCGRVQ